MSRISIDVTAEEHQKLKALAALQGKSIKEYVLDRTLGAAKGTDEERAIGELVDFLSSRVEQARRGEVVNQSVEEIFNEVYAELNGVNG